MPEVIHDGKPLGNVDTAWLHMEDPTNLMMVTGIFVFDGPLDVLRLKETVNARMVERFARLKCKVVQQGAGAHWVSDPTFNLDAHIHRIALPSPGDEIQLRETVSDLMSTPLDFSKPLWQMHILEDYGEASVLLLRIHHCIGDGVALVHVLLSAADADAGAPWPVFQGPPLLGKGSRRSMIGKLWRGAARTLEATRRLTGTLIQEGVESLIHPGHVLELAVTATESLAVLAKMLLLPSDPKTVFKGPLGVAKRAAWSAPVPIAQVKAISQAFGGTVNDVLLTGVCGALRRYMEKRGDPSTGIEFNAMVPVNLRPAGDADKLGNQFGLIYLSLPIGIVDPVERLAEVKRRMDLIKRSPEPFVAFQILQTLGLAPKEVAETVVSMFGVKATAVMTNVIGPRKPIYFAGTKVRTTMFWVPQSGRMGLGVSIFSYNEEVVLGIATDAGLVPDPEVIARAFEDEFKELMQVARHFGRRLPPAPETPALPAPEPRRRKAAVRKKGAKRRAVAAKVRKAAPASAPGRGKRKPAPARPRRSPGRVRPSSAG